MRPKTDAPIRQRFDMIDNATKNDRTFQYRGKNNNNFTYNSFFQALF